MPPSKSDIRAAVLERRDAIPEFTRIENALALVEHIDALDTAPGQIIAAYWPIRSEIDPRPLLFALHERGARMALPVVLDDALVFRELTRTTQLVPTGFGTSGPSEEAAVVAPDILLMPLAAFDDNGNRIGYGRGYYDRTITVMRSEGLEPRPIGLAHATQEVDAISVEPHDVPMNAVLCETGLRPMSTGMAVFA